MEKGGDLEKVMHNGATPLFTACQQGHLEVVRLLVEKGADVDKAKEDGRPHRGCRLARAGRGPGVGARIKQMFGARMRLTLSRWLLMSHRQHPLCTASSKQQRAWGCWR